VLDAPFFNIGDFLFRDTCVSSTQLNRTLCNKQSLSRVESTKLQVYSFQKLILFSQVMNVLVALVHKTNGYLLR
jgi:predicted thioredoxin/glutaredoxin